MAAWLSLLQSSILTRALCTVRYTEDTSAIDFFHGVQTHVFTGTAPKPEQRQPFISATTDINTSLWWSGYGAMPVVHINLKQLAELKLPQWHVGSAHSELMVWPGAAAFAKASREIVFSTEEQVPAAVTTEYKLAWTCKAAFLPNGHKKGEFPQQKEFTLTSLKLKVLEQLQGSTAPLKVEVNVTQPKGEIRRKVFVFKRGCKVDHQEHRSHSCSEYQQSRCRWLNVRLH